MMDGRIVGVTTATIALIVLGFVALGLFTSLPGLLIAGFIAAVTGTGAGAVAEPDRSGRTATVVVGYIAMLIVGYVLVGQTASRYAPSGSRGGPAVTPRRAASAARLQSPRPN
jgi:hypothetical protein